MTIIKFLQILPYVAILCFCVWRLVQNKKNKPIKFDNQNTNSLLDRKWEILGLYRERCFEHYQNIKCDMYATNDPHNLKVLTIELVEHDKKREYDLAIFNLIELQSKTNFRYETLKFKFISIEEFEELKQICSQLNPHNQ